jgi:hypothetical protein
MSDSGLNNRGKDFLQRATKDSNLLKFNLGPNLFDPGHFSNVCGMQKFDKKILTIYYVDTIFYFKSIVEWASYINGMLIMPKKNLPKL